MTDTPAPFTDEQIDELLSADLDGEFDAAARDLGFEPDVARAQLNATPGVPERRAALAAARDLFAVVPAYDELAAARVRTNAKQHADSAQQHERAQRRSRWLTAIGAAAAALVLVVGIGFALNNTGGSSSKSSASSAGGAVEAPASTAAGSMYSFGEAATPRELANSLHKSRLASPASGTRSPSSIQPANDSASGYSTEQLNSAKSAATNSVTSRGPQACASQAKAFAATTAPPTRFGVATVAGKPVLVATYSVDRTEVVVILTPECGLLLQQTFPSSP